MACPECGSVRRHRATCSQAPNVLGRRSITLELARDWYARFGHTEAISPTGRELFAFLLAEVERLRKGVR